MAVGKAGPGIIRVGELAISFTSCKSGVGPELLNRTVELAQVARVVSKVENWRSSGLTSLDTSQTQIQVFELGHPNIYTIDELLECFVGSVLHFPSFRISRTQGNNRISQKESQ